MGHVPPPYNYGKEIPDVNKYDKVFVVDVSFGDRTRFLFDEWEDKGIDVTWIDHHKTVIEAVKDYNVKGKRRIGTAACGLSWLRKERRYWSISLRKTGARWICSHSRLTCLVIRRYV